MRGRVAGSRRPASSERELDAEVEGYVVAVHVVPAGEGYTVVVTNPGDLGPAELAAYLRGALEQVEGSVSRSDGMW